MINKQMSKIFEGNWDQIKGKLKSKWGKLTDDDIKKMQGSYDEFSGKMKKLYGYEVSEIENELHDFFNEEHIETLKSHAKEAKDSLVENTSKVKEVVTESLNEYFEKFKEKSSDIEEKVASYFKSNPFKVIGMAAFTGFVLASLFKSNNKR